MRSALLLALLSSMALAAGPDNSKVCKAGAPCEGITYVQTQCVATGSLGPCTAYEFGRTRCDSTTATLKFCDGSSWGAIGSAAANMATTDTTQTISGAKTFSSGTVLVSKVQAAFTDVRVSNTSSSAGAGSSVTLIGSGTDGAQWNLDGNTHHSQLYVNAGGRFDLINYSGAANGIRLMTGATPTARLTILDGSAAFSVPVSSTAGLSGTTGAFSGAITSSVAAGSNAINLNTGAKINMGGFTLDGTSAVLTVNSNVVASQFSSSAGFVAATINIYGTSAAVTAFAGGGQASATAITKEVVFVTTVATAGDSVRLPPTGVGQHVVVYNDGANSLDVFPASATSIDALATNAAYSLAAGASREFFAKTATLWKSKP